MGPLRQGGCLLIKFGRSARKILDKPHPVWYYSRASSRCFYKCALVAQLDRVFGYEPKGRGFESLRAHQAGAKFALLRLIFLSATENKPSARSLAPPFRKKSRSAHLFGCKRPHDGSLSLPTFCEFERVQLPPPKCRKYLFHVAFTDSTPENLDFTRLSGVLFFHLFPLWSLFVLYSDFLAWPQRANDQIVTFRYRISHCRSIASVFCSFDGLCRLQIWAKGVILCRNKPMMER